MRLAVCCCLLVLVAGIKEFDLSDAFGLDDPDDTVPLKTTKEPQPGQGGAADVIPKKPTSKPQPDVGGEEGFELGGDDPHKPPTMKPKPGHGGGGGGVIPKKPTSKPQPDVGGEEDFDLGDALGGDDPHKPPTMKPKPGHGGGGGGEFGDGDLGEVGHYDPSEDDNKKSGRAMQPSAGGGGAEQGQAEGNPSVLAGIVSAVAVAAVGAVSSFIAYQKKKLCFKGATDDPENVNMDSHKGDQFDPQAQNTLLSK